MEYCSRGSLFHVLQDKSLKMTWTLCFSFAFQMTRGVSKLHSWEPQLLHRDFKSLNLLVSEDYHIKVCDFGLSRFDTSSNMETLMKTRGTFAYTAPEVYLNQKYLTRSDVYSMGIVLWELFYRCLSGVYQQPYSEYPNLVMDFQIIIQATKKNLRPTLPEKTPKVLLDIFNECVAPDAADRMECLQLLERLKGAENIYKQNTEEWDQLLLNN